MVGNHLFSAFPFRLVRLELRTDQTGAARRDWLEETLKKCVSPRTKALERYSTCTMLCKRTVKGSRLI